MKKNILAILFFAFPVASLNAMDREEKKEAEKTKLTFVAAKPGENLDQYRDILMSEYLKMTTEEKKEDVSKTLEKTFPQLKSFIWAKYNIIKILSGNDPVGFFSFEILNDEATIIALHVLPVLEKYSHNAYSQLINWTKKEFPNAHTINTPCLSCMPKLREKIMKHGFVEDVPCTKELYPSGGIPGYSLYLK